jgi:hypothetical protein
MKTWTIDEMLEHRPCALYDRRQLVKLWDGRYRLSVLDVLALDIPVVARVWAALQDGGHVKPAIERIVYRAVSDLALPEIEPWATKWLSGEDRTKETILSVRSEIKTQAAWWLLEAALYLHMDAPSWSATAVAKAYAATTTSYASGWKAHREERARQIEDIVTVVKDKP